MIKKETVYKIMVDNIHKAFNNSRYELVPSKDGYVHIEDAETYHRILQEYEEEFNKKTSSWCYWFRSEFYSTKRLLKQDAQFEPMNAYLKLDNGSIEKFFEDCGFKLIVGTDNTLRAVYIDDAAKLFNTLVIPKLNEEMKKTLNLSGVAYSKRKSLHSEYVLDFTNLK